MNIRVNLRELYLCWTGRATSIPKQVKTKPPKNNISNPPSNERPPYNLKMSEPHIEPVPGKIPCGLKWGEVIIIYG